jgi:hypothetical protein
MTGKGDAEQFVDRCALSIKAQDTKDEIGSAVASAYARNLSLLWEYTRASGMQVCAYTAGLISQSSRGKRTEEVENAAER